MDAAEAEDYEYQEEEQIFFKKPSKKINLYKRSYASLCMKDKIQLDHILHFEWPHYHQLLQIANETGINEDITAITNKLIELQGMCKAAWYVVCAT